MRANITELNINEYGRFDELKAKVDRGKAKDYFEKMEGKTLPDYRISIKIDQLLKDFITKDGFELAE
jgi:type I restriction enzyme R subunit